MSNAARSLFEPTSIKGLKLRNRFFRSATFEGLAHTDGRVSSEYCAFLAKLARGQVGCIVTGHTFVAPEGQVRPRQLAIHADELIPGLRRITDAVHAEGGSVVVQLAHGGAYAHGPTTCREVVGPSRLEQADGSLQCRAMTLDEVRALPRAFARGAMRALEAGFDGVQIHAAHGYLLSQFLSPHWNRRDDEYGGDLERRARLVLEVVQAIRDEVGDDYPVLMKLNSQDFLPDGFTEDEMLLLARRLENQGLDALELSGGTVASGDKSPVRAGTFLGDGEAWFRESARRYKAERAMPLILVGGIRSLETAEGLLQDGLCDFVSLSRPLVREPGLVRRWVEGDRRPSECVSDNLCFRSILTGKGLHCVRAERDRRKAETA